MQYLLGTGGQLDASLASVSVVGDDGGEVARSAGKGAAVTKLLLDVAHNGTFGQAGQRQDVADTQIGLTSILRMEVQREGERGVNIPVWR